MVQRESVAEVRFQFIIDLDPRGRVAMQRDMELVRAIFAQIQSLKDTKGKKKIAVIGWDDWVVQRHVEMLASAGFIELSSKFVPLSGDAPECFVKDLTWSGHDFAAALTNETVWEHIKKKLSPAELANLSLDVIKSASVAVLNAYTLAKLGFSAS